MVNPSGIEVATQRIEEIRQRLTTFENRANPARLESDVESFGQILNDKLDKPASSDTEAMEGIVERQAQLNGLDPNLAKAVAKAESGFNPKAVSSAGAQGLMQLMPSTAEGLGVKALLDPSDNARGGTQYLKSLMDKYHSVPKALAAYNAGPGTVDKYGGIPPYRETQQYVKRVMQYQNQYEQQAE